MSSASLHKYRKYLFAAPREAPKYKHSASNRRYGCARVVNAL